MEVEMYRLVIGTLVSFFVGVYVGKCLFKDKLFTNK